MSIADEANAYMQQKPRNIADDAASFQQQAPADVTQLQGFNDAVLPGSQSIPEKKVPGFIDKLDMLTTGVHRGVTHFTLALMSKLPLGDKYQNAIKDVDTKVEAEQQHNIDTYTGYYPQVGEVGGEILATLPAGGLMGKAAQGAASLGKMAPTGLKTLAKYGSSALSGAGVLAGVESQRYDPENPGQLINTEAAGEALKNPLSYAIPALGTKLSTWSEASKKLGAAKELYPDITARDLKGIVDPITGKVKQSVTQKISNAFFNIPAAVTGSGKQVKQMDGADGVISNFIQKISGTKQAMTADNLTAYSSNIFQGTLKNMEKQEDKLWSGGFKNTIVPNIQGVKDDVINAIDMLKTNKTPGWEASVNSLQNGLRKGKLTVEDVKQLQSGISKAAISARGLDGGVGNDLANNLSGVKDNLLNHIQNSLSPEAMSEFSAARAFSAKKFELFSKVPMLKKALEDETNSHKLVNSLISEGGVIPPKKTALGILSGDEQNIIGATKLRQALEASDEGGKVNIDKFLKATNDNSQMKYILNKDAYNSLKGMNVYLQNINAASKGGVGTQIATGMGVAGATAGAGLSGMGNVAIAAPLLSYAAATFVANHSPAKYALNALTKNLSEGTRELLNKAVGRHLSRAGFFVTDGVVKHKDDKELEQQ